MCVGRCNRLSSVCSVVVDREAPCLFFLPLSELVPAQRSEGEWPREGSETEGRSQSAWRRACAEKEEVKLKRKTAVGFEASERRKGRGGSATRAPKCGAIGSRRN